MKTPAFPPCLVAAAFAIFCQTSPADSISGSLVGIEATTAVTTEPAPHIRVIPGLFTLSRKGGTERELTVWIGYSGTATPGADYRPLPEQVTFAAGEEQTDLLVQAVDDDEIERDETLIARLYDPTLGPIPLFEIDPLREQATVTIIDSDVPPGNLPVVSIEANRRIAEETAAPLRRINLVGEFTVSRTGPTLHDLPVWIHYSGTATPREDYEPLPLLVRIPAGERSASFPVTAFFDQEPEGIELVIATVSNCPPEGMLGPCYGFMIDEATATDTVFIREDGLTVATVHISEPSAGDRFAPGEPIAIHATAIHLESYIDRVGFFSDEKRIGNSHIFFVRDPDPGTPITHHFEWKGAPLGAHVLTSRATIPIGGPAEDLILTIVSNPVPITVGENPGAISAFEITRIRPNPENGAVELTWNSHPGATYAVERSLGLTMFEEVASGVESSGTSTTFTVSDVSADVTDQYYRVKEE